MPDGTNQDEPKISKADWDAARKRLGIKPRTYNNWTEVKRDKGEREAERLYWEDFQPSRTDTRSRKTSTTSSTLN